MTKVITWLGIVLFALSPVCALAGDIERLDLMTGVWRMDAPGGAVEEWWMPAEANTKAAAFRWAQDGEIIAIELTIISEEEDGTWLRFKHFYADYTPWERDEPNVYRLLSIADDRAVFEQVSSNPKVPDIFIYEKTPGGLRFRGTNNQGCATDCGDLVIDFKRVVAP